MLVLLIAEVLPLSIVNATVLPVLFTLPSKLTLSAPSKRINGAVKFPLIVTLETVG